MVLDVTKVTAYPTMIMQKKVLDQAATVHPNSQWWVKADGVDLVPGLEESMRMEWSGDIDLIAGAIQNLYSLT